MSQWSDLVAALAVWPGLFPLAGGALKLRADEAGETLMTRVLPDFVSPKAVAGVELALGALVLLVPVSAFAAAALLALAAGVATWGVFNVPEASCGCFGARSEPVSPRTAVRAGLLALLALAPAVAGAAWWDASLAGVALTLVAGAVLVALTPELRSRDARLAVNEAVCAHRPAPPRVTLARLRGSTLWADAKQYLAADAPTEQWRDGCWRYLAYPARYDGEDATAVFALYLGRSRAADGVAFVATDEERVLGQIKGRK
jgi:hypothetical protein